MRFVFILFACLFAFPAAGAEAEDALKRFRVAPGLKASLFAAEPMLANPVAFTIDERGRFFVAETYRHSAVGAAFRYYEGVFDIRSHMDWLDDDLAARTVEDRLELLQRRLGTNFAKISIASEKVRLIEDRNNDGVADFQTIFAEGFNRPLDGIGAGLLARRGELYYTCVPDLWRLADRNGDGKAEIRQTMHTGFGVHIAFLGHDLHGLRMGPDGRLYFTVGDRGANVTSREGKRLIYPDEGAVFRCELDGSDLEVFARGLRNPQELAFNDVGDLFTGDNNSDGGDRVRWVHLVEGGDSGWRIGYQHIATPPRRGPWNAERLWTPRHDTQAAYILPPIANLGYGPSGLTYYPGVGLPEKYKGHFFLADFRGGASSGIHSFSLKPKGASYELDAYEQFVWECLPTDVEFGPDGALYFSDWVETWNKTGKGRLFRVADPALASNALAQETKALIASNLKEREAKDLGELLSHPDQRVRQEAQFALVEMDPGPMLLRSIAVRGTNLTARLHAIWGLGQVVRRATKTADEQSQFALEICTAANVAEVRAQAARCLGESRVPRSAPALLRLLADPEPRVQMFAALGLARHKHAPAQGDLFALLARNNDSDPYVRHAAVRALASVGDTAALRSRTNHASRAVRLGACLALRQLNDPAVADFLKDSDTLIRLEAARAINDLPIESAFPKLAALIEEASLAVADSAARSSQTGRANGVEAALSAIAAEPDATTLAEQLFTRVINAHFRLGTPENAAALVKFAGQPEITESLRIETLNALADWPKPSNRDRVMGLYRPLPARDGAAARAAFGPANSGLLDSRSAAIQVATAKTIRALGIKDAAPLLVELATKDGSDPVFRIEAMKAIAAISPDSLAPVLEALDSSDSSLQAQAIRLRAEIAPQTALPRIKEMLADNSILKRQAALSALAILPEGEADAILSANLDRVLAKQLPVELTLDVLDAASKRGSPEVLAKIQRFEQTRAKGDNLSPFVETLHGGDASAGRKIFFERAEVFCSRCHKMNGNGGEAGPDLTGVGRRHPREYILESIVLPNAKIAAGWDNVMVRLNDGRSFAGKLKSENDSELVIDSPEDGDMTVKKNEIKSRERALSAMPDEFRQILSKQDIRNLVEFLAGSK